MADRLRFGSVGIDNEGGLALIVFTPTGQTRYVDLTYQQAATCIQVLAAAMVDPRRLRVEARADRERGEATT
jgi:hypothetical protein